MSKTRKLSKLFVIVIYERNKNFTILYTENEKYYSRFHGFCTTNEEKKISIKYYSDI